MTKLQKIRHIITLIYIYIIGNSIDNNHHPMNRTLLGILLILMMFGHNYVLNQPQVLQTQFQEIHQITVTQFNLLYSLPSAIAIFFILPLGILYDKYSEKIVIGSGIVLVFGQLLVAVFGTRQEDYAFSVLTAGRIMEGTTAEVLYMIQANIASSWMGKLAGLTLILPEIGQIANVFLTLQITQKFGVETALYIGLLTCVVSFVACIFLFKEIKKHKKLHEGAVQLMVNSPQTKDDNQKDLNMVEETGTTEERQLEILKKNNNESTSLKKVSKPKKPTENPVNILQAGQIFWLVVVLCAINQCLYFPFLDNAKVLIQTRFCVPQQKTSFYLCLPYLSAITLSILVGQHILYKYQRKKLIFISSLLPLIGHSIIFFIKNCDKEKIGSGLQEVLLVLGFVIFGMGIAGYYSISMPAVGLCVPESIRGTAFACLGFLQTVTMTAVPLISGQIIQQDSANNDNYMQGYRNSSFFFVFLCLSATTVSFIIMIKATPDSFKYSEQELQLLDKQFGTHENRKLQEQHTQVQTV